MKNRPFFTRASSFGCYEGVLAEAINLFKFLGVRRLSSPLGRLLLACDMTDIDAIIPVPLSIKSLRKRGFNQSSLLAKVVSDNTGIPLFMNVLAKKRETLPQIGLSAKERISNIKGAFRAEKNLHGMKVLLIDDVMTTTATVNECSKELLKGRAKDVTVLTLARASDL